MFDRKEKFILASASPRRKELFALLTKDFEILVSEADEESISRDIPPDIYVEELALLKASAVAGTIGKQKHVFVVGADTVVTLDGAILGKPRDAKDAFDMLCALSGRTHVVYTGFCVMRMEDANSVCKAAATEVTFKELTDEQIRAYIEIGEPMDKAGAYGIQGRGGLLIKKISGDYNNVVGLPVSELYDTFKEDFDIDLF